MFLHFFLFISIHSWILIYHHRHHHPHRQREKNERIGFSGYDPMKCGNKLNFTTNNATTHTDKQTY